MGKRLNKQAPLDRLKDSLKKQSRLDDKNVTYLNCYGGELEQNRKKDFGKKLMLSELPIKTKAGIAKWFIKIKHYTRNVEIELKLLSKDFVFLPTLGEMANFVKKKYSEIPELDPVKNRYITLEHFNELVGNTITYEYVTNYIFKKKETKENQDEINIPKKQTHSNGEQKDYLRSLITPSVRKFTKIEKEEIYDRLVCMGFADEIKKEIYNFIIKNGLDNKKIIKLLKSLKSYKLQRHLGRVKNIISKLSK